MNYILMARLGLFNSLGTNFQFWSSIFIFRYLQVRGFARATFPDVRLLPNDTPICTVKGLISQMYF